MTSLSPVARGYRRLTPHNIGHVARPRGEYAIEAVQAVSADEHRAGTFWSTRDVLHLGVLVQTYTLCSRPRPLCL